MFRRVLRVAVPVAVAGALTAAGGLSQAASTPGWRITTVLSTNNSGAGELAATGAGSAWAAGTNCADASCSRNTLVVRHWTGKAWTVVSVPKAYVNSGAEFGASAVAAASGNAWVMNSVAAGANNATAVLHWTGRGWGATAKLPAMVTSAVATSPANAWALGAAATSASSGTPYAAHFDGRKWSAVRVPVSGLHASATSAKNIWVAGFSRLSSSGPPVLGIMHFDGKTWHTTPAPRLGLTAKQAAFPAGIAALSATNVWVGGIILGSTSAPPKAFLIHWNGAKWAAVKFPYASAELTAMAQDGHGGIWTGVLLLGSATPKAYLAHYRNGTWTRVAVPASRGDITSPQALAWIPGTRSLWGLGYELPVSLAGIAREVILKYGA
jgi:hypothetical protein